MTKIFSKIQLVQFCLVPSVLVVVFLRQVVLVYTAGLSPWMGGGFGMFSTVDRAFSFSSSSYGGTKRWLDIQGISTEGKIIKIDVMSTNDSELSNKIKLLIAVPKNPALLEDIARQIMNTKRFKKDKNRETYQLPNPSDLSQNSEELQAIQLQKVKIKVMHFNYDYNTNRISYKSLFPEKEFLSELN